MRDNELEHEPNFPVHKLIALEEKISHPRWVVPVLPDQELEALLIAATNLAKTGEDLHSKACQRFYDSALNTSFVKILTDDAVSSWKGNIQQCVRSNCERLIKLCALKMDDPRLLQLLAVMLNPLNKFHSFNANRPSESFSVGGTGPVKNPLTPSSSSSGLHLSTVLPTTTAFEESSINESLTSQPLIPTTVDVTSAPPETTASPINDTTSLSDTAETSSSTTNKLFARPNHHRNPKGWLVDFINLFGQCGGFQRLQERFEMLAHGNTSIPREAGRPPDQTRSLDRLPDSNGPDESALVGGESRSTSPAVYQASLPRVTPVTSAWDLLRPFGMCTPLLTQHTIHTYFKPILDIIPAVLEHLSDDELKKEATNLEGRSDTVSCLVKAAKCLAGRLPDEQNREAVRNLELFLLKMILRLMQMPSFNSKMSALNEVNQIIGTVTQQMKPDWFTSAFIATWITENHVLDIALRGSLHQPQYVDRLEKMLRFLIKEGALTLDDLDLIWRAQQGKHETIVKNLHDLLAKLAWDFTPDQLDHLFDCFKASWSTSNKKQSDKLLEVIRRIAEDDKDGVMAHKVLALFWNLAHSADVCNESMDMALANHLKILEYSCTPDKDAQKMLWLDKCVEELKASELWALPALKHMRDICCLHQPTPQGLPTTVTSGGPQSPHRPIQFRQEVIERLQNEHSLVILVTDSLTAYMEKVRAVVQENPLLNWEEWLPDGRYPHALQIHERLSFLRFLLKDGQLWLCAEQAKQIWVCLAENPASPSDREACFRWFSKLMGEEPDLDPGINLHFFRQNILTLDPTLLTHSGIKCFERFFKAVNMKEGKLKIKHRRFVMDDDDLIGLDYLWRVIMECDDDLASRGIELLREAAAAPGPRKLPPVHHDTFLGACCDRMRALQAGLQTHNEDEANVCLIRMVRVLRVLQEYVVECDRRYQHDRQFLPTYRAGRGRHCSLLVRFQTTQKQLDDLDIYTHSNETLQSLRSQIYKKLKCSAGGSLKLELYTNNEILDSTLDKKLLSQIPIRDKSLLTGKVTLGSSNGQSSNESSSDSSTESPLPSLMPEAYLPGVLLSRSRDHIPYILELLQLGVERNYAPLRDAAHTLVQLVPPHHYTVECLTIALMSADDGALKEMLYDPPPPTIAYNVQVLYSMVMPALDPLSNQCRQIQLAAVHWAPLLLHTLIDKSFLAGASADTLRVGYLSLLRLNKLVLTALGHLVELLTPDSLDNPQGDVSDSRNVSEVLHEALQTICSELMVKAVAEKLAQAMGDQMMSGDHAAVNQLLLWRVPTQNTIRAVCELALAAAAPIVNEGLHSEEEVLIDRHSLHLHQDDVARVRECMEVVTVCVALAGGRIESLMKENWWHELVVQLMVNCPSPQVRVSCAEAILAMCSWGNSSSPSMSPNASSSITNAQGGSGSAAAIALPILLGVAENAAGTPGARHAQQLLQLVCRLMALAGPKASRPLLPKQVERLRVAASIKPGLVIDDILLEGHLNITKEIFIHSSNEVKLEYGAHAEKNGNLIKEVVCTFLFPYSWAWRCMSRGIADVTNELDRPPVCRGATSANAACDLLVAMAQRCAPNMRVLADLLIEMFYSDTSIKPTDWEYFPAVGSRSPAGLVGLKNAGATCYMNSVLQQLYMVPEIRDALLTVQGAATDPNEDFSGEEILSTNSATLENADDYNVCILKQVQAIFAHLHYSKQQFYIPRGLWMYFKLQGEPVNLREQQDAVEFFMSLVESLDEALKALGHEQLMAKTLGGSYSDQKICRGCPHRYYKEEPFSVVSLDIRNLSRLQESLEAYVRGELLEGADAYHCDKCNEKVVTVKRLVLNKLPPVLAIQLKRFEYDFEKVCAIKFNDYFEFPRELDVEPYTVWGLAKAEGDSFALWEDRGGAAASVEDSSPNTPPETRYCLTGIVVHSGQASGGHYYSYILHRDKHGTCHWMKFDDGEVSECAMGEDEEMKAQCFGGDYMGERQSYRMQKRWWNAYMLFYTRVDVLEARMLADPMNNLTLTELPLPGPIGQCVRRGNIAFNHRFEVFSPEHFNLLKRLCVTRIASTGPHQQMQWNAEQEELRVITTQLATKFLFHVCFKTKKSLRGSLSDWSDIISHRLRASANCRSWFSLHALLSRPRRLTGYLLYCPSAEVRNSFVRIVVMLAHFAQNDPPLIAQCIQPNPLHLSLSDQLMGVPLALAIVPGPNASSSLLSTMNPEQQQALRHNMPLLFNLFHSYALLGVPERHQLLRLDCLHAVLYSCMDDSSQSQMKFQYPEMVKLHQLISMLTRCCDISGHRQVSSAGAGVPPMPNPFCVDPLPPMPLPQACADILFGKATFIKRLIEECSGSKEVIRFVQYLSWENPGWSKAALTELLCQMAYAYYQELVHHAEVLTAIISLEDSWQTHRIHNVIKGTDTSSERDGLLDTATRSRPHHERRAYACIKLVTIAASTWPQAANLLREQPSVKRKWRAARTWLHECLERRRSTHRAWSPTTSGTPTANNMPPSAGVSPNASNDTGTGYFLERTNSARRILERAYQIVPEEDEDTDGSDGGSDSEPCSDTGTIPDALSQAGAEDSTSSRRIAMSELAKLSKSDGSVPPDQSAVTSQERWDKSAGVESVNDSAPSRPSSPVEQSTEIVTASTSTAPSYNYIINNLEQKFHWQ